MGTSTQFAARPVTGVIITFTIFSRVAFAGVSYIDGDAVTCATQALALGLTHITGVGSASSAGRIAFPLVIMMSQCLLRKHCSYWFLCLCFFNYPLLSQCMHNLEKLLTAVRDMLTIA